MVKVLSIFLATLAAISPVVQAGACTPGLQYCGSTLTRYGKSAPRAPFLSLVSSDDTDEARRRSSSSYAQN
ncbi:hypothetical protein E4U34_000434 [Claviceps purpurea]|nr:hypothetical protein E4U34_000434 [Claviceps purpurea]